MRDDYYNIIYDIETEASADEDLVRAINPPYPAFDPSGVKTGNCRTPREAEQKVGSARLAHSEQEANYWSEKMVRRALAAETGRVLTIGYLRVSEQDDCAVIDDGGGDESLLIRKFWKGFDLLRAKRGHYIGWNSGGGMSTGFDLGFLIKRSWILGLPIPEEVMKGRFVHEVFIDLMQEWSLYQFKTFAKLDHCARVLGLGSKAEQECTGADFASWYRDPGRREEALSYAKLDLTLTRAIYTKLFQGTPTNSSIYKNHA